MKASTMTTTKRKKRPTKPHRIPLDVLTSCRGISVLAQAVLFRCYVLSDTDGIAAGVFGSNSLAGLTRDDVQRALSELTAAGLITVDYASRHDYGHRAVVTLLKWED